MLGRFVAARVAPRRARPRRRRWPARERLARSARSSGPRDGAAASTRSTRPTPARAIVDAVELKAATPDEVAGGAARAAPAARPRTWRFRSTRRSPALLDAIQAARRPRQGAHRGRDRRGVPRAGGGRPLPRRLRAAGGSPFKATAGLHHPVRGEQALTYAADAPRARHARLPERLRRRRRSSRSRSALERALQACCVEEDPRAFASDGDALAWRGHRIATEAGACAPLFAGFGSCSFAEPVADLRRSGLLTLKIDEHARPRSRELGRVRAAPAATDFPIQNLPLGVFRRAPGEPPRVGCAIGDAVLDLSACADASLLTRPARGARRGRPRARP